MNPVGQHIKINLVPEQQTGLYTTPKPHAEAVIVAVSPDAATTLVPGDRVLVHKIRIIRVEDGVFVDIEFVNGTL